MEKKNTNITVSNHLHLDEQGKRYHQFFDHFVNVVNIFLVALWDDMYYPLYIFQGFHFRKNKILLLSERD